MRRTGWLVLFAVALLAIAPSFSAAQSRLFDGVSLSGQLAAPSSAEYNFDASRGDQIAVRALGLNGLDTMITVRGPDGTDLFTGFDDPWSPDPADSVVTFTAPDGGAYSVVVQAEGDSSGDFVLQFNQSGPAPTGLLPAGQAVPVPISAEAGPIRLQFASKPDCPAVLVVSPGGDHGFAAMLTLRNAQGTRIAQLNASTEQRVTVAPNSGAYVAEIQILPGSADGQLVLTVTCAAEQPACTTPPVAAETPPLAQPTGLLMVQSGGDLVIGGALQGEIGQASPLLGYTFNGAAGQEIVIQVTGVSFAFQPVVSLIDPGFTQLARAENTPGEFRPGDAVLRAVLPTDGPYTALVGSADQAPGAFLIRLAEGVASAPATLVAGQPATVSAELAASGVRYTFSALDACPTALDVQAADGGALANSLIVRHADGALVGRLAKSSLSGASLLVPAASGDYEVVIPALDGASPFTLSVGCQAESLACTEGGSPQLISTPTPGSAPLATATITGLTPTATLRVSADGAFVGVVNVASANVRRGDSQAYNVDRALPRGTQVEVIGLSDTGSGWFKVRLDDGAEGWMSPQVLTVAGDLSGLPRLQPPPPPRQAAPTSAPGAPTSTPDNNSGGASGEFTGGESQATSAPPPTPQRFLCACPNEQIEVDDCNRCLFNDQGNPRICPGNSKPPTCNPF